jgi:hypothetical protein
MTIFRRKHQPTPPPFAPYRPPAQPPAAPTVHTLSPAQRQTIDWTEPDASQPLAKRPVTYVPNASDIIQMPNVTMASPDANVTANVTPFATIEGKTLGSHSDRARAWIRYAMPLCGGVAVVATIMAWTLAKVPILSFWSLLVFGLSFVLSYTLLLMDYWRHTPEGVALDSSKQLWGFLRAEQAHRHEIERSAWNMQRERIEERSSTSGK